MKPGLRISSKNYSRAKYLKVLLVRALQIRRALESRPSAGDTMSDVGIFK
jgi:hypothetical protein